MPVLYVQKPKEAARTEVHVESVADLPVKDFKDSLLEKFDVPLEEQCLIFAGRVLRPSKTLGHYQVTDGCTIFLLRKKKREDSPTPENPRSGFGNIISNRRILRAIGRVLSNPSLIQAMIADTPLVGNPQIQEALQNPELLASLGEPDAIADYLRNNPEMAVMTEGILRMYSMLFGGTDSIEDDDDIVDMVEGSLEDDMEQRNQEDMRRLARQQEEMFEHSRALAAHHRRRSTEEPSQQPPAGTGPEIHGSQGEGGPPAATGGAGDTGGGAITHSMLATALSGAISAQDSPLVSSSQDLSSTALSSGPDSLSSDGFSVPVPPSDTASGRSEQAGSVTSVGGSITSSALQQALASAMSTAAPQEQAVAQEHQPSIRERYSSQLAQLHNMGITDDVSSLHALEATGGDIPTALEILLGGGQ